MSQWRIYRRCLFSFKQQLWRAISRKRLGLFGRTRLAAAARRGDAARVAFLLSHGADANVRDTLGRSPLTEALAGGHDACAALLRAAGGTEDLPALMGVALALPLLPAPPAAVAVGHDSGAIHLRDSGTGAVTATLAGHVGTVHSLVSLPGGLLASAGGDFTVRVWRTDTGDAVAALRGHERQVVSLALLRDGRLGSASHDGTVRLWDLVRCECTAVLLHSSPTFSVAALPNGGLATVG